VKAVDRFANGNILLLFIQGMILGLIPCGLVISSVITAASYSSSGIAAFTLMFLFGLSTIPALFSITYFGSFFLSLKETKIFKLLFSIAMLLNAYYVLGYALKLF
jgi:sulfite exporter TauE/SafE